MMIQTDSIIDQYPFVKKILIAYGKYFCESLETLGGLASTQKATSGSIQHTPEQMALGNKELTSGILCRKVATFFRDCARKNGSYGAAEVRS
jgi:hypothetical protein